MAKGNILMAAIYAMDASPNKHWKYAQYNNLCYMAVLGKTARALRKERNLAKGTSVIVLLDMEEREQIADKQREVAGYLRQGKGYKEIKRLVCADELEE